MSVMFKAADHQRVFNQLSDHPRIFPNSAINLLMGLNVLSATLPEKFKRQSKSLGGQQALLELLKEVGRADLSVGRIYEGHINALLLIDHYGSERQKETYFADAAEGKLFGVWNTENPTDGLRLVMNDIEIKLSGCKNFCSGALNIQRPIVTAKIEGKYQMLILELDDNTGLEEDWSLWNPSGMKASLSCKINFTGLSLSKTQFLGEVEDYYKEPFYTWGAVRFSAVQLGGAQAIADIVIEHLKKLKRHTNAVQEMRLGELAILLETARLWVIEASRLDSGFGLINDNSQKVNFANMMRTVTVNICEKTIAIAEKSVGLQGMMKSHPLEKRIRDMRVYLKQANPDGALLSIGKNMASKS